MVLLIDSEIECNLSQTDHYFNKHKSWYKLDLDGSFITRNYSYIEETVKLKPKAVKPAAKKMSRKTTKNMDKFKKPEFLKFPHDITVNLAVGFGLFFLLVFLCFFMYAFLGEIKFVEEIVEDYAKGGADARYTKLQLTSPQIIIRNSTLS